MLVVVGEKGELCRMRRRLTNAVANRTRDVEVSQRRSKFRVNVRLRPDAACFRYVSTLPKLTDGLFIGPIDRALEIS